MARPKGSKAMREQVKQDDPKPRVRKSREEIIAEKRASRGPISDLRNSMAVDESLMEAGYVYRYVNDTPGRIKSFMSRGWELVEDPEKASHIGEGSETSSTNIGSAVSLHAGVDSANSAYDTYLMRIEEELYHEDQENKERELDMIDEALTRQEGSFGVEGSYGGKAKMTHSGSGGYKP